MQTLQRPQSLRSRWKLLLALLLYVTEVILVVLALGTNILEKSSSRLAAVVLLPAAGLAQMLAPIAGALHHALLVLIIGVWGLFSIHLAVRCVHGLTCRPVRL